MEFACIYHGYIIYSLNNWLWFDIHFLRLFVGLFRRTDGKFLSEYVFREQSHALTVLHGLNEQRKSNTLCDVIICVEGEQFPCHRNILAACSPYFLAMFTGEAISIHLCLRYIFKRKFLIYYPSSVAWMYTYTSLYNVKVHNIPIPRDCFCKSRVTSLCFTKECMVCPFSNKSMTLGLKIDW